MCAELADLGMDLARAAAARALADLTAPPPVEEPPPEPPPEPIPASAATPRRTAGIHLRAPSCKAVDPALLFTHLTASVLSCITLEARLLAGTPGGGAALQTNAPKPGGPDPRRTPLRETFRHLTAKHAGQAALLREINTNIDEQLAADPAQTLNLPTLFTTICENLNFEPDFATLPDQYLDLLCDDPNPQATSPP